MTANVDRQTRAADSFRSTGAFSLSMLALAGAALLASAAPARADEVYGLIGLPGVGLGYSHPVNDRFALRGDLTTSGSYSKSGNYDGNPFVGTLKMQRAGLFADWFVTGGWRLTGGVTFNDAKIKLNGQGSGQPFNVGGATIILDPTDTFDATIEFPKTTPFVGLGYGHAPGTGWGFVFDLGVSIGTPTVTANVSQSVYTKIDAVAGPGTAQANIDQEVQRVREDVTKMHVLPQLSVGVNYRF